MSYEDVSKETGRRSEVWRHFLLDKNTEKCKCKVASCEKILMAKNGSTRGLLQHLRVFHANSSSSESQESEDSTAVPSKKKAINSYMLKKTREEKEEEDRKYK